MPTPTQIPFVAPDGTPGYVDSSAAQQAASSGYKPALAMRSKDGTKGLVAFSDLKDAMANGYKTEGQYQQAQSPADNSGGVLNGSMRFGEGLMSAGINAAKGAYHTVADAPSTPIEQAIAAQPGGGQLGVAAYRALVAPQIDQASQAIQGAKSPDMQTRIRSGAHALAALIPGVGPAAAAVGDSMRPQIESGNYAGAAGNLAGNAGIAYLGGKAASALAPEATVAGQNYTPSHAAAFEGLTAKANGMGPNFIPQNLTADALSPIRQSASDMLATGTPAEQAIARNVTARGVEPLDRLGAVHSVIQKSLSNLEGQHAPALSQVAGTPVDMTPIQQGLAAQIKPGMSAADIAGIKDLIDRSGQITNLGDLNSFRQIMNEEASPSYRQTPTRAGQASAPQQVATDAANAVRSRYFDLMQQATGTDFQPLKNQESKLLTTKEAIERMQSPEAKAEATFNAPTTFKESLGNIANIVKEPRATVTQTMLRESPATRAAMLIRKSMTNLPDASPVPPQAIAPASTNAPQLPANASPTSVTGTTVQPTPPVVPTPLLANPQGQLPPSAVQSLLANSGQSLQLPADTSGMAVTQTPRTPYPSLNEAAARTRISPTQFAEPANVGASGSAPVGASNPLQRFLQAGDLDPTITNPSADDLKRAIAGMRKKRGK